jgi:hypothetical protein
MTLDLAYAQLQLYARADWNSAAKDYVNKHCLVLAAINAHAGLIAVTKCTFHGSGHFTLADEGGTAAVVIEVLAEDDETVIDFCAWPTDKPGTFATMFGADALGMTKVVDPATWSFGGVLDIYRTPLRWLQAGCDGCVILNHKHVAIWLRDGLGPIRVEDVEHALQLEKMLNLPPWPRSKILIPHSPEKRPA